MLTWLSRREIQETMHAGNANAAASAPPPTSSPQKQVATGEEGSVAAGQVAALATASGTGTPSSSMSKHNRQRLEGGLGESRRGPGSGVDTTGVILSVGQSAAVGDDSVEGCAARPLLSVAQAAATQRERCCHALSGLALTAVSAFFRSRLQGCEALQRQGRSESRPGARSEGRAAMLVPLSHLPAHPPPPEE